MVSLVFSKGTFDIQSESIKILNVDVDDEIDMGDEDCTKMVSITSSITIYVNPNATKYFDNELHEVRYGWYHPCYSLHCHELGRFKMSNGGLVIHYGNDDSVITKVVKDTT